MPERRRTGRARSFALRRRPPRKGGGANGRPDLACPCARPPVKLAAMSASYLAALVILSALVIVLGGTTLYYKQRARRARLDGRGWPIPTVPLDQFDSVFAHDPLGPTLATEVRFLGEGDGIPGGTSDRETWILAVLATGARRLFEFGTCTGKTAYLWALNAGIDASISTLTLAPGDRTQCQRRAGDSTEAERYALAESAFTELYYTGTPAAAKINQLFGDSRDKRQQADFGSEVVAGARPSYFGVPRRPYDREERPRLRIASTVLADVGCPYWV